MSCHVMSVHVTSRHVMSCRFMSCHVNIGSHQRVCLADDIDRLMREQRKQTNIVDYLTLTSTTDDMKTDDVKSELIINKPDGIITELKTTG